MEPQLTVGSMWMQSRVRLAWGTHTRVPGLSPSMGAALPGCFLLRVATWLLGYHPGLLTMAKPLQVMGDVERLGAVWLPFHHIH